MKTRPPPRDPRVKAPTRGRGQPVARDSAVQLSCQREDPVYGVDLLDPSHEGTEMAVRPSFTPHCREFLKIPGGEGLAKLAHQATPPAFLPLASLTNHVLSSPWSRWQRSLPQVGDGGESSSPWYGLASNIRMGQYHIIAEEADRG